MPNGKLRSFSLLALSLCTASCGLATPDIVETGAPLAPTNTRITVLNIVRHVQEELACAAFAINQRNRSVAKKNIVPWLEKGGVAKVTLTLTVDEKTSLAPTLSDTIAFQNSVKSFPIGGNVVSSKSFSLGIGASGTAEANRKIQTDYTFSIQDDLLHSNDPNFTIEKQCDPKTGAYSPPPTQTVEGGVMIDGDLKIANSMIGLLAPYILWSDESGVPKPPVALQPPDTLQTDITFTLNGSGTVSPSIKLVPIAYGSSSSPLVTASRNSINEVLVTLGPNNPATATAHNISKASPGSGAAVGAM